MKIRRIKIHSEHYPDIVSVIQIEVDIENARNVIKQRTGLSYRPGEFVTPNQVMEFVEAALHIQPQASKDADLIDAIVLVLTHEIAAIIDGEECFVVNDGVDLNDSEPYEGKCDVDERLSDYIVYSRNPAGHFVFETDKIVQHFLDGGDGYEEFIVSAEPISRKRKRKTTPTLKKPSKSELLELIQIAVEREDYEEAALLRDMLNRLYP